eukprot:CAMPEP_0202114438 /NCGR_PEP_ID=MMETSP0965-20130614/36265_1 /ASSEMBLY_ACC=CAM_ASM_000507 /TAXON_ID=4773 /ORGANISM="Schizochytrium aggregatum, Strain ATCC28209" /LENGTH=70 /DNA_ID=CAMNT_0048684141 /DNA_START=255 /DNA_END=467 /DNA_ORIENTATION=-
MANKVKTAARQLQHCTLRHMDRSLLARGKTLRLAQRQVKVPVAHTLSATARPRDRLFLSVMGRTELSDSP